MNERKTLLQQHGKAVYAALRRMTQDHHLLERCFRFWLHNFARDTALPVNPFVAALHDYVGLNTDQQRVLSVALYAALSRDVQTLPAIPKALLPQIAPKATLASVEDVPEPPANAPAQQLVLTAYLMQVIAALSRQNAELIEEFRVAIMKEFPAGKLSEQVHTTICDWADSGFKTLAWQQPPQTTEAPYIAHQLYVLICDIFGPMAADQAVGRAVRETTEIPAAQEYSPSKLL